MMLSAVACLSEPEGGAFVTGPIDTFTDASGASMEDVLQATLTMSVAVDWGDVQLAGFPEDQLTTEVDALSETASCRLDVEGNIETCNAEFSGRLASTSGWWEFEVNDHWVTWSAAGVQFGFDKRVDMSDAAAAVVAENLASAGIPFTSGTLGIWLVFGMDAREFGGRPASAQVPFVYVSTSEADPSTDAYVGVDLTLE